MNRIPRRTVSVAGCALLVVLTGCGGSAGGGGAEGGGGESVPEDLPQGVIDEILDEAYADDDEEVAHARMTEVENRVAACMAELGFEYTPVDYLSTHGTGAAAELGVEWGTLEFAEQFGYAATTRPFGEDQFVDPNEVRYESMSQQELQAWSEALWGPRSQGGDEPEAYDWQTAGCQGSAQHEVDVENGLAGGAYEALEDELDAMWAAIASDPRTSELDAEWASCMAGAGYAGLETPADAEAFIYDKAAAVYNVSPAEAEDESFDDQQEARLAAVTDEEIATAVADFTCREEVDLARRQAEIGVEHQQEFYDTHKAEVDAWRDSLAEG
ncbi:hypothetical protein ICW40_01850 [Actinotalea ferrariae]|uniref:hypothetical protein n=1 Tax=Actinotalea ferrariae TaxID=1386098 RepID=UPI001C8B2CE4|nr:hypothetical protein [Actinotalea ferrariae]MBX9243548.1 hypothetical protein [Actinotalea ferrariae]